jgi:hypothetical protein
MKGYHNTSTQQHHLPLSLPVRKNVVNIPVTGCNCLLQLVVSPGNTACGMQTGNSEENLPCVLFVMYLSLYGEL